MMNALYVLELIEIIVYCASSEFDTTLDTNQTTQRSLTNRVYIFVCTTPPGQ